MVKVYVMETCPDCTRVKQVAAGNPDFQIIDIGEHIRNLKEFLRLRDTRSEFDDARRGGYAGIPAFLMPDGTVTFDAATAGLDLDATAPQGSACRIDGTGC